MQHSGPGIWSTNDNLGLVIDGILTTERHGGG